MVRFLVKFPAAFPLFALLLLGAARPTSSAAIIVLAPTGSTNGSFTITQDITFTITTGVPSLSTLVFLMDEWVISDGSLDSSFYSPNLLLSKNGAAPVAYTASNIVDNWAMASAGSITANDGYFRLAGGPAWAVNDTLTLKAATYTIQPGTGWNPQSTQTFTGQMFVTDGNGVKVSNTVAVPEPGSAALLIGGMALLGLRRRR